MPDVLSYSPGAQVCDNLPCTMQALVDLAGRGAALWPRKRTYAMIPHICMSGIMAQSASMSAIPSTETSSARSRAGVILTAMRVTPHIER